MDAETAHQDDESGAQDETRPVAKADAAESLTNPDYNRLKLYKKGVNLMADEKLEDACEVFEQALRIDPGSVDTLLKLGYARFHLDQYADALKAYDRVLEIDVTHPEAWNLKSLVDYEQKNYSKALDAVENAVESDPNYGMAWYNKACYLSLLNQVPEALEALKRSIEIDVKNARKAVKDRDFVNVRIEEGFRRIIEVVVLESIRQGYHTLGSIVWTTFLNKVDTEEALTKLLEKGLITRHEKREGFHRIPTYDLAKTLAERVTVEKKGFLGLTRKRVTGSVQIFRMLGESVQVAKTSIEGEDIKNTISSFDAFIDPKKCGPVMIEQFFEEHRDIRLWRVRLEHRGQEYLLEHKERMLATMENIGVAVTRKLRDDYDYSADRSQ
ncbi:MAG: tetratricopeptide repeat protein [Thaumarchaeota archaeon]|nr:tetratricopeptide repeat protein [Nitrososphaerota archaeon]